MRKPLVILFAILSAMMLLAIACSSDEANPNATATTAPPDTVAPGDRPTEPPTAPPTAVPPTSAPVTIEPTTPGSGPVTLDIDVNSDALQFDVDTLSVPAGAEVVLNLNNRSATQTHNWALVEAGTKDAVAADGIGSGQANNWLPVNDSRIVASTILIGPGDSGQVTFTAPSAGVYEFVCTFPAHNTTMSGEFIVN